MKTGILILLSALVTSVSYAHIGDQVDCSSAYYDLSGRVTCEVVQCSKDYQTFLGSWEGPFTTVDKATGQKRTYRNQVTYSADDCLKNVEKTHAGFGDTFIIGRQTDIFPTLVVDGKEVAPDKIELGLLITGRNSAGQPFLRTVNGSDKRTDYKLEKKDEQTITSVWSFFQKDGYCQDGKCYDIKIITSDGKDMSYTQGHKRDVKISLEAYEPGTQNKVYESELASGYHILRK